MLLGHRFLRLLPLIFTAACPEPLCKEGFVGDPGAAPELVPAALTDQGFVLKRAGDAIDLITPIQGGKILAAGALVRNVAACGNLRGELRKDDAGRPGALVVYDERTINLIPLQAGETAPAGSGWARPGRLDFPMPSINDVANVPACPNVQPFDVVDAPMWVKLTYTDIELRQATAQVALTPRCTGESPQERDLCLCECKANYTIERCTK